MRRFSALVVMGIVLAAGSAWADDGDGADDAMAGDEAAEAPEADAPEAEAPEVDATADVDVQTPAAASSGGGYGSAGCGLGTLLFSPSNGFTQVFASTTNGTSGSQTFGITSGTSGCDGAGYQPGSATAFVETNRSALAKDVARGNGATIAGLTEVAGCSNSKAVGQTLQQNFTKIFPDATVSDTQVSQSVISVLKSDAKLSCGNLG